MVNANIFDIIYKYTILYIFKQKQKIYIMKKLIEKIVINTPLFIKIWFLGPSIKRKYNKQKGLETKIIYDNRDFK